VIIIAVLYIAAIHIFRVLHLFWSASFFFKRITAEHCVFRR